VRIALATDWFAPRVGGIESQLQQLAVRLSERGHSVDVLTTTPGDPGSGGFAVRRLDVLTLPGVGVAVSPRLPRAVDRELRRGYDIVHCHASVVSPLGYTAAAVARRMGLPVVVTFHSVLRYKRHLLRLARLVARGTEAQIRWTAVSSTVADQASTALRQPVDILPNGADMPFWNAMASPRAGADGDDGDDVDEGDEPVRGVTLVSAGRLERKKRALALTRAFLSARARSGVNATLVLAGEGAARRRIERELRGNPDAGVELVGWRSREQLRSLYRSADGFALASRHESFGIAALEARAAGLPVIAMRSAGCRDFLRDGDDALLCGDDRDLETQLTRFLGDARLRTRLRSAKVCLDRYDWPAVLASHERIYSLAISSGVSSPAAAAMP